MSVVEATEHLRHAMRDAGCTGDATIYVSADDFERLCLSLDRMEARSSAAVTVTHSRHLRTELQVAGIKIRRRMRAT